MNKGLALHCLLALSAAACSSGGSGTEARPPMTDTTPDPREALRMFALPESTGPLPDVTNRYADDPRAAELGRQFFFEKRFSGPLLDEANNGLPGTLGMQGEAGKVSCSGCHLPESGYLDRRSPRQQISLGSGWTRRRAPSLLGVGQATLLNWDGRRDAAFNQPFTPLEDPLEFNSSRLYIAQRIKELYREPYEAVFGALPSLDQYDELAPDEAGCEELPVDVAHGSCDKPGKDDVEVTRVVVNLAKSIQAYTRQISCGRSRFDNWLDGDDAALTADEIAGAQLFVGKGYCVTCHKGPFFTDQKFHNVGMRPDFEFFIGEFDDPGAAEGVALALADPMNSEGQFSDGSDHRLDFWRNPDLQLLGAFRTPSLRCVNRRPSFMHTGQLRSLQDVVRFFNKGGATEGFLGEAEIEALGLTDAEIAQLVAFLQSLDGDGPDPALLEAPVLPPDPEE